MKIKIVLVSDFDGSEAELAEMKKLEGVKIPLVRHNDIWKISEVTAEL